MRILIDTPLLLSALFNPARLSKKTQGALKDGDNEVFVSLIQLPKLAHQDPFDRMLIGQAIHRRLVLMSYEKNLRVIKRWDWRYSRSHL